MYELADREIVENRPDLAHVVHGALHGGAYVGHEDDGDVAVYPYGLVEVVVVYLAAVLALDHDVAGFQDAQNLDDAVVGVLGEVDDAVGEHLAPDVEPVHVALGAAGGDVAPCLVSRQVHQVGEAANDLALELVGVGEEVAVVKGVSDVVGAVAE